MALPIKSDIRLKLANLALAIWLSTVPTTITFGVFGLHGLQICKNLETSLPSTSKNEIKVLCDQKAWETTRGYIFLIGFFITLPTWYWFYLSMKLRRINKS